MQRDPRCCSCVTQRWTQPAAAALLDAFSGGEVGIWSAGTQPAEYIEPVILDVLAEIGIRPAKAFPKPLSAEVIDLVDVVVSMGCGDACPIVEGKRYEDWDVPTRPS